MTKLQTTVFPLIIVLVVLLANSVSAQNNLTDPYEMYENYIKAIGGFEKIMAESTSYFESTIEVAGLSGTVSTWSKTPNFTRQDVDLKVFKNSGGDNGKVQWSTDANGKVQYHRDENMLKRRELQKHTATYEYLNRDSKIFSLSFIGEETVEGINCYVVKTENTINTDSSWTYFNKETSLIIKSIAYTPDSESHTLFSDYRDVDGMLISFRQEINTLPVGQSVVNQITKYEYNIAIDPMMFEPPGTDVKDYRFVEGNQAENIPFTYYMSHIFLKVIVDCKERWWILDSGAGISVIDSTFADELGLKQEGEMEGQGVGSKVAIRFVKCPPFQMEGIEFDEQTIGSINLKELLKKADMDAVGVLGFDFMSRFVIKIDYANKLISFYDPNTFEYTGEGSTVEAPVRGSIFSVPATIDGTYSSMFNLDLGASGNSVHYPFAKQNDFLKRDGIEGLSWGAGGELRGKNVKFKSLEVGGYEVKDPIIDIPLNDVVGGFGASETSGNIGNSFLKHFILYLNYDKQQVILEKGDDFNREFARGRSGLQVMIGDDKTYEVVFVPSNTPASKAGFMVGDIIKSINEIDVKNIDGLESISRIMRGDIGTKLKFKIKRGEIEKELKLKLQDIY